jgi:O-antigen ligase
VLAGAAWTSSHYLRHRVTQVLVEISEYRDSGTTTSSGQRLAFWSTSLDMVKQAPVFGHGTGSIRAMFERTAPPSSPGSLLYRATNPHNQTFAVAIQLGIVGACLLWAMWLAHMLLFRGGGAASWFGMVVVVQNIVSSLVNSHLFDFTQGWTYVICVGIAGGMAQARDASTASGPERPLEGRLGSATYANSGEPAKRSV